MSTPSSGRSPLWFCYECHAEMRPLMNPDPHCASCNGTFLEEMDGTGEDDPRQLAAENEQTQAILNLLNHGFPGAGTGGGGAMFGLGGAGSGAEPSPRRSSRNTTSNTGGSRTIRIDMRSGPGGRTVTVHRDGSPMGGGPPILPAGFPTLPEFVQNRRGSAPTSPIDDEIETPYGPRSRRFRGPPPPLPDDPRALLMHYFAAMLAGNPGLMLDELGGPIQGGGAFGDYVFNQEGLDRIITQLMETAGHSKPNPAPDDMIAGLSRTLLTYDCDLVKSGQSCAICTEYFAPLDPNAKNETQAAPRPDENTSPGSGVAITLPCAHSFHDDCIITWLKNSGTCPVCRYALVEQPGGAAPTGAPAPPPGAASSSNVPPPIVPPPNEAFQSFATETTDTRPQGDRTPSSRSAASNTTNRPSSPQGQADSFFSTVGGRGPLLESIFGFMGGGRGRTHEPEHSSSSTRDNSTRDSQSSSSAATHSSSPAPGANSQQSESRSTRTSPNPSSSPPQFFRDRGQRGGDTSSRSGPGYHGSHRWDDVD